MHVVIFVITLILFAKISDNEYLKEERFVIAMGLFIGLLITKSTSFFFLKFIRSRGINHRNIMFLENDTSSELLKTIFEQRKDYGFKIFELAEKDKGNINEMVHFWKSNGIHTLYIPSEFSNLEKDYEREIFKQAEANKVRISLIPNIVQNNYFRYDLTYIGTQPVLSQVRFPLDYLTNYILKRAFDILFSVVVLVTICSWLFPLLAILIKISSKGPVFFLQNRYGFHEGVFKCIKFRTMHCNADSASKTTDENDKRITSIGKFLRKSSLDELPQFINVLLGDMSVVGPRPHMLMVDDYYKMKIGRYSIRSHVKPGITGLAQVNGLRGDKGDMVIEMQKRILADTFYVKNWSFVLDLVIILKTVFLVIRGDKNAI